MNERHRRWGGKLPHIEVTGSTYFITFALRRNAKPLSDVERKIVFDACLHQNNTHWILHALVVMPSHTHILATPCRDNKGVTIPLEKILKVLKGYTAHEINKLRSRRGSLWTPGYYETLVRDGKGITSFYNYIWENPVKEGLAKVAEEYPFFWVDKRYL